MEVQVGELKAQADLRFNYQPRVIEFKEGKSLPIIDSTIDTNPPYTQGKYKVFYGSYLQD